MRQKWVIGNWKLNGSFNANAALIDAVRKQSTISDTVQMGICPPFPYLAQLQKLLDNSGIVLGAQNVCEHSKGAYTGEVAAEMLQELGCQIVIVGHSERRALFGDTVELVGRKARAVAAAGMRPVICLGETEAQRENDQTETVLAEQLDAALATLSAEQSARIILAYEPVWAIGTGKTATPAIAQQAHAFLRNRVAAQDTTLAARLPILYGGSVKAANAAELFGMPDVDGGLIGSAALSAEEFVGIYRAMQ